MQSCLIKPKVELQSKFHNICEINLTNEHNCSYFFYKIFAYN
jgi:hypothetical protein